VKDIFNKLDEATVRMEQIILIAGMINDGECLPDPLRNFLEEEGKKTLQRCFPDAPASLLEDADDGDYEVFREHFAEWMYESKKLGFLIQFARPVMRYSDNAKSSTYSWGYYATHWVYGDTLEAAVTEGLEWAAKREAKEKAEAINPSRKSKGNRKGGAA